MTTSTTLELSPQIVRETNRVAPTDKLRTASFFKKLTPKVQEGILKESQQLAAAMRMHGVSGLAVGEHLFNIRQLLQPAKGRPKKGEAETGSKLFKKYLKNFSFTARHADRYIRMYSIATEHFPQTVLDAAMASGVKLLVHNTDRPFGAYTDAVKILPPPRNPDPEAAKRYLVKLEDTRRERERRVKKSNKKKGPVTIEVADSETLLKESYRFIGRRLDRLSTSRARVRFIESLVGMILAKIGVGHQSFEATAIPQEFAVKRGRPKLGDTKADKIEATQTAAAAS